MSSIHANWSKRLEAAQLDSSWQGQIEARVLRFLLSRYGSATEAAPLPDCPLFQGEAPHGRAKLPLSSQQQRARLSHIAQVEKQRPSEKRMGVDSSIEGLAYQEFLLRRNHEAQQKSDDKPLTKTILRYVGVVIWAVVVLLICYFTSS